jgi:hypothetical protein
MALEVDPSNEELVQSLSVKLCQSQHGLKKYSEAEQACDRALKIDPEAVDANLAQAEVYMGQEKFDQVGVVLLLCLRVWCHYVRWCLFIVVCVVCCGDVGLSLFFRLYLGGVAGVGGLWLVAECRW